MRSRREVALVRSCAAYTRTYREVRAKQRGRPDTVARIVPVKTGDIVKLKKPHPCGVNEWEIVRVGMDIGLLCRGCNRKVLLVRSEFDRRFRGFLRPRGWERGGLACRFDRTLQPLVLGIVRVVDLDVDVVSL